MIEKGAKVRIKDSVIDSYLVDFQRRVRDRIGEVTGHLRHREGVALVSYPAMGRKKFFNAGAIHEGDLEIVEPPREGS